MTDITFPTNLPMLPPGVTLRADGPRTRARILTPAALAFVADLERRFGATRRELLEARLDLQQRFDAGERPDFLAATADIRRGDWRVGPIPADLRDRTVEITGPVERKMIINALNSGADVFMADFEDSNAPTFANVIDGQINLYDAVRRTIDFDHQETGKTYRLADDVATLMVRPRGWHLIDKHLLVDGAPVSAALLDFGLFFFHNARELIARGSGPYFYLPKLENHLEAGLWNSVFEHAQATLGIPSGTIKATVLIETITAAFEMDEILHQLRTHSVGLNCGRWDYIFSFIKRFRADPAFVLPDRGSVGMDRHCMRSYSQLLIKTCHRRGAQAMGGMAAQIPIKNDPARHDAAMAKVRADKRREASDGHDGTWVAHPGLVAIAREEFEAIRPATDRLAVLREDVTVRAEDLLAVPEGHITASGLRQNLEVGVRYLEAWLRGSGCVPIHDLMEDAATAEISRTQVWQWIQHAAVLDDGRTIDADLVRSILDEELTTLKSSMGDQDFGSGRFALARELFEDLVIRPDLAEFLTLAAYEHI